jgi:hypothetical protein
MIQFTKPINLNGAELVDELKAGGVSVTGWPKLDGDVFSLDIPDADKAKAAPIVAAHNGTIIPPDNSADKAALLTRLGITADEAKLLLS